MARERMLVSRSACLNYGRMDRWGFADETRRQGRYGIAVAIVCPRYRRLVLSQLSPENIRALYVSARGQQTDARSECWRMLVPQLVGIGVIKLTIEQIDEGGKARDRKDIHDALLAIDRKSGFTYQHEDQVGKPMWGHEEHALSVDQPPAPLPAAASRRQEQSVRAGPPSGTFCRPPGTR